MKTVAFHTLGCKLNFAETSYIGKQLLEVGYRKAQDDEQADVCIVNTCSVTDAADKKCRQIIHKLYKKHPNAFMVITGCYAQLKPEDVSKIEGVDAVLGMNEKFSVPEFLQAITDKKTHGAEIHCSEIRTVDAYHTAGSADDRTRHFLKVQDGCDYHCTYCTIPMARGKSRNQSIAQTVAEAQEAIDTGAKEIVLTGVNIGDFGRSTGETFFDLLKALDNTTGDVRYRISSIEPNLLTDEIIEYVATSRHIAPHFHIPLQSGCNEVLKLMRRRYNRELFAKKIHKIKEVMPHAFIGVDVIVGVRGETQEYFDDTYQFIESLPISQLHVFSYSERANTDMLKIEHVVSPKDKKLRSQQLHDLSEKKTTAFYAENDGYKGMVLWENQKKGKTMHGFTDNYLNIEAPLDRAKMNTFEEVVYHNEEFGIRS